MKEKIVGKNERSLRIYLILAALLFAAAIAVAIVGHIVRTQAGSSGASAGANGLAVATIASSRLDGTDCILTLKQGTNAINWTGIYAKTASGKIVSAVSADAVKGTITFPLTDGTLNIYVPDTAGNLAQFILEPTS